MNGTHRLPDALAPLINVRRGAEGDTQTPNATKYKIINDKGQDNDKSTFSSKFRAYLKRDLKGITLESLKINTNEIGKRWMRDKDINLPDGYYQHVVRSNVQNNHTDDRRSGPPGALVELSFSAIH